MVISTRIGYWTIIAFLLGVSIYLEVRNRELEYNEVYIRGSNSHLMKALIHAQEVNFTLLNKKTLTDDAKN